MDNPLEILRWMLLAVIFSPLLIAGILALAWKCCVGLTRRLAIWFALLHVGLTGGLTWLAADQLLEKAAWSTPGDTPRATFEPIAVPGDPGLGSQSGGQIHETSWTLLTLGASSARLPSSEIQLFFGLDGLNVWLIALTSLMTLVAILVSWNSIATDQSSFYAWLFVLETGILGSFSAFDLVLFYVFFELTLIPSFFLIGEWGVGAARREAARQFFLYTLFGSLLTLIGVIGIVVMNPLPVVERNVGLTIQHEMMNPDKSLARLDSGPYTFSLPRLIRNVQTWSRYYPAAVETANREATAAAAALQQAQDRLREAPTDSERLQQRDLLHRLAHEKATVFTTVREQAEYYRQAHICFFFLLMAGFAVKTPIIPFHTWLPSAYYAAPIGVTVMLAAVMSKLGTYGILRIVLPLAPDAAFEYGLSVFGVLGAAGIIYAALCAYAQRDVKSLVAYSSISHLGLVVLALFALNREGLTGACLHMVNHGLSTGALFALLAFLLDRYGTLDREAYGGLIALFPGFAFVMCVVSLATVGLPGLNNFVSEMLMIAGLFDPVHTQSLGYGLAVAAASGIFLSAWYTMTLLKQLFFGPIKTPDSSTRDPNLTAARDFNSREWFVYGVLLILCFVMGLSPQPVIDTIRPEANVIVASADMARMRAGFAPAPAERVPVMPIPMVDAHEQVAGLP